MICRFCGQDIDPTDLLHGLTCDGQQGKVEAVLDRQHTRRLAQRGMTQAEAHADPDYLDMLLAAIYDVARVQSVLTGQDVWVHLGVERMASGNPSALGSQFKRAARLHYIRRDPSGSRKDSTRPPTHGRPERVWISCLCGTEGAK